MSPLLDPARSRAVIIGTDTYTRLPGLPSVHGGVAALVETLADPARWGIPPSHVRTLSNPDSPQAVADAVRAASAEVAVDGLLIVYFAGHGIIDAATGELHLAIGSTDPDSAYATGVPYEWIRRDVHRSRSDHRLVILDCCYAGRAIAGMDGATRIADRVEIERSCVIVAASANQIALAPPDERYTAFTGALLEVLGNGVDGGPDPLDVVSVFEEILRMQHARGRPLPELRARNGGDRIPLVHNAKAPTAIEEPWMATRSRTAREQSQRLGQVLKGSDRASDPELAGATVAIVGHSPDGFIGVRLDRQLTRSPADLLGAESAALLGRIPVFDGGPVRDAILILAEVPRSARPARCVPVVDGIVVVPHTAVPTVAHDLSAAYVFLGYFGWTPGQLEREIDRHELIVTDEQLVDRLDSADLR